MTEAHSPSRSLNKDARAVRKRRVASMLKRGSLLLFIGAAAAIVFVAYRPKPVPVDIAFADRGDVEVLVEEDGKTRVKDRYLLTAPVAGQLQRITLRVGDDVDPEQPLVHLASIAPPLLDSRTRAEAEARVAAARAAQRQAEAAQKGAQAALSFANSQLARQQELAGKRAVSQQALERAELDVKTQKEQLASALFGARVAAHQLELAKVVLDGGTEMKPKNGGGIVLRSPVKGRVLKLYSTSEGFVQPGTPLLELGDCSALEVVVDVLTADAVKLSAGAEARIVRWGGEGTLRGHIGRIEPSAFTRLSALGVEEQRVNVIVELDTPHEQWTSLGDGYRVETQLLADRSEQVIRIPESAVFRSTEGFSTFVVDDDTTTLQPIEVGKRNARWVEITEGLDVGAQVITHPSDRVIAGAHVEPRGKP